MVPKIVQTPQCVTGILIIGPGSFRKMLKNICYLIYVYATEKPLPIAI